MFEKSLYDLIRGLRNHKGQEREYVQSSLRECRQEIKGQDMDLKATAVLKLTYLEMFGHDMSWASFHILEVMSSPKYSQKRVGYLGAVQSFRPDTEVLMLAENLLKKDLTSPQMPTISLPLVAIPHVINPSMANSLLSELLPRLTHSSAYIRKKTIVTLYRLALVYPEILRTAWPKIKERLSDDNEDPGVTAAVVNVVCELGWRRPHDFLPLAPRLFTLLVDGNNNWMAIKIIKLFATLTPLEPRLVNKLLPPITNIIKTTPAMSLLYECINGIIQGGILQSAQGTTKGDEMARLCVTKLRGMLTIDGDPNLKYVALLAFNRIVELHPYLVTMHEDVVLECIDDLDISIRLQALDLVVGMVNPDNLASIVERLIRQLRDSPHLSLADDPVNDRADMSGITPSADMDELDPEQNIRRPEKEPDQPPPLPDDYRRNVIQQIIGMCSRNTYANISDFEWYIDILVQLVRCVPPVHSSDETAGSHNFENARNDIAYEVGCELRNVAVRVKSSRAEATRAAESLISIDKRATLFPPSGNGGSGVLEPAAWIVGEFAGLVLDPNGVLASLAHPTTEQLPGVTICAYIQAVVKLFALLASRGEQSWTAERKITLSLLATKVVDFLDPLTTHPNLEVQERAVEYLELIRLAGEAIDSQAASTDYGTYMQPPLLLSHAIPALFRGMDLNPVAKDAQQKVTIQDDLNLETPINDNLVWLLSQASANNGPSQIDDEFEEFYTQRPKPQPVVVEPAANRIPDFEISYQQSGSDYLDADHAAKRRADRMERNKDDPFYISSETNSGRATPNSNRLKTYNGEALDVDSIPIMELDLGGEDIPKPGRGSGQQTAGRKQRATLEILADETVEDSGTSSNDLPREALKAVKPKKNPLLVDSSILGSLSLEGPSSRSSGAEFARHAAEEAEMAEAVKELERLRLQMQRNAEEVKMPEGEPEEVVVKRKKKKKASDAAAATEDGAPGSVAVEKKKKKKKKTTAEPEDIPQVPDADAEVSATTKPKKKKKSRQITFGDDETTAASNTA